MKRIKYISRFARLFTSEDLTKLGEEFKKNNQKNDITGVFMASGDLFFQIIEGPAEKVDELMTKIQQDSRHRDVLVLNVEEDKDTRIFPDWSMRKVDLSAQASLENNTLKAVLETIFQQKRLITNLTDTVERSIWHHFSKEND